MKNKLKKGLSIFGIASTLSFPLSYCKKAEVKVPLPLTIYLDSKSMSSENRELYIDTLERLDTQTTDVVKVDLIKTIKEYDGRMPEFLKPGEYIISELEYNFPYDEPPGVCADSILGSEDRGIILMNSVVLWPESKDNTLGSLLMSQIIGESRDSNDLTCRLYDRNFEVKELSQNELFKLAEMCGTVKINWKTGKTKWKTGKIK